MKTRILSYVLFAALFLSACSKKDWQQKNGVFWYLPTMTENQAKNLAQYDVVVIDYENFINNPNVIEVLTKSNQDLKIFLYLNPTEIFEPMWDDKPWSIELLKELQKRPNWWMYQPNGEKIGMWTGMKTLNMRADCPLYDGKTYWQFIANEFIHILKDPRIHGCLVDNSWGGDEAGIRWIDTHQGQKFDFDRDGQGDKDYYQIDTQWEAGMKNFFKAIRKAKGKNFPIVANPGNLSYQEEVDGKQFEHFPYSHHHIKEYPDHWEANIFIAKQYKIAFINPDKDNYFLGLCTSVMLDNAIFFDGQNQLYNEEKYNLKLGKPLKKMRKMEDNLYARPFENGNVFIRDGQKAWIEYNSGQVRSE
jgi:hypothetical protein